MKTGMNAEGEGPQLNGDGAGAAVGCAGQGNAAGWKLPKAEPWPEPVDGSALLEELKAMLTRYVVLPKWGAETLALWVAHTYAFQLRDVTTYIALESPQHRCGKSTLITVLSELANRAVVSSNVSPSAFFRVIEDLQPTLLIDEVDTFLHGSEELRGILNAGYTRRTAYVLRVSSGWQDGEGLGWFNEAPAAARRAGRPAEEGVGGGGVGGVARGPTGRCSNVERGAPGSRTQGPALVRFSCWCPKVIARIGRLPETLADRCIVIRMQRRMPDEQCERLRSLDGTPLRRRCLRFVADHASEIAAARPAIPPELNDRAADIWEPLLALADLAGGGWPEAARQAAIGLSASGQEGDPMGALLLDIFRLFVVNKIDRALSRALAAGLDGYGDRPWKASQKGAHTTELWLSQQLRPYGIHPRCMRVNGERGRGYSLEDFTDACRRYVPRSEAEALRKEFLEERSESTAAKGADVRGEEKNSGGKPPHSIG